MDAHTVSSYLVSRRVKSYCYHESSHNLNMYVSSYIMLDKLLQANIMRETIITKNVSFKVAAS